MTCNSGSDHSCSFKRSQRNLTKQVLNVTFELESHIDDGDDDDDGHENVN